MAAALSREQLLTMYFRLGYSNIEIRTVLAGKHNIVLSERHTKRLLNRLGLYQRKNLSDDIEIAEFIQKQIRASGKLHGYKWMHLKCRQAGLMVSRETVRVILSILDPVGVRLRSTQQIVRRTYHSRGPNFVWHVDGYDKLKKYGIAISGCIDGFSRKIIWLEASYTNNNPALIAGYFVNAVQACGGCPSIVRADMGTENVLIEQMQNFFRRNQANNSFVYGKSTRNQRIEAWWAMLRKHCSQYWMELLQTLCDEGHFCGDSLDQELIRFCFLEIIQTELDEISIEWNHHHIRKSHERGGNVRNGRPAIMYDAPEIFEAEDYICRVPEEELHECREECNFKSDIPCDEDLHELCLLLIHENDLQIPTNGEEARQIYRFLRPILRAEIG
ncbi:hypothetical protein HOLleu_00032 [Holothuria leucospilota]|uniref:Integrase core domain-containing protein n=1 Tax=Holothuria leucospilota TaxID=206669 RepID=A0A9Q1CNI2_HOLLE|nr:hypothetical protein HOLleu_00032 [Holothuria leucospilota]